MFIISIFKLGNDKAINDDKNKNRTGADIDHRIANVWESVPRNKP